MNKKKTDWDSIGLGGIWVLLGMFQMLTILTARNTYVSLSIFFQGILGFFLYAVAIFYYLKIKKRRK